MMPPPPRPVEQAGSMDQPSGAAAPRPYTIRPASMADAAALPALEQAAAQAFCTIPELKWLADGDTLPLPTHQACITARTCWVGVDDQDRPLGFLSAHPYGNALHILEMSVIPAAQGRGLGRHLLRAACTGAQALGLRSVTLTTFVTVPWNAPFYARQGFSVVPPSAQDARLRAILAHEVAQGFAAESRCAMRLDLPPAP